jgi:hypothetical protein
MTGDNMWFEILLIFTSERCKSQHLQEKLLAGHLAFDQPGLASRHDSQPMYSIASFFDLSCTIMSVLSS